MTKKERTKLDKYYLRNYGVEYSWYELQWKLQGEACALCNRLKKPDQRRFHLDHNHKTGKVRGIVCYYCNKFVIGRHNIASAETLYGYMKRYE
jgi:Recombination endonuclease VII